MDGVAEGQAWGASGNADGAGMLPGEDLLRFAAREL